MSSYTTPGQQRDGLASSTRAPESAILPTISRLFQMAADAKTPISVRAPSLPPQFALPITPRTYGDANVETDGMFKKWLDTSAATTPRTAGRHSVGSSQNNTNRVQSKVVKPIEPADLTSAAQNAAHAFGSSAFRFHDRDEMARIDADLELALRTATAQWSSEFRNLPAPPTSQQSPVKNKDSEGVLLGDTMAPKTSAGNLSVAAANAAVRLAEKRLQSLDSALMRLQNAATVECRERAHLLGRIRLGITSLVHGDDEVAGSGFMSIVTHMQSEADALTHQCAELSDELHAERLKAEGLSAEIAAYQPRVQQHRAEMRACQAQIHQLEQSLAEQTSTSTADVTQMQSRVAELLAELEDQRSLTEQAQQQIEVLRQELIDTQEKAASDASAAAASAALMVASASENPFMTRTASVRFVEEGEEDEDEEDGEEGRDTFEVKPLDHIISRIESVSLVEPIETIPEAEPVTEAAADFVTSPVSEEERQADEEVDMIAAIKPTEQSSDANADNVPTSLADLARKPSFKRTSSVSSNGGSGPAGAPPKFKKQPSLIRQRSNTVAPIAPPPQIAAVSDDKPRRLNRGASIISRQSSTLSRQSSIASETDMGTDLDDLRDEGFDADSPRGNAGNAKLSARLAALAAPREKNNVTVNAIIPGMVRTVDQAEASAANAGADIAIAGHTVSADSKPGIRRQGTLNAGAPRASLFPRTSGVTVSAAALAVISNATGAVVQASTATEAASAATTYMMVNGVVINAKPGRRQASVGETEQTEMDTHTRVAIAISEALVKADMQPLPPAMADLTGPDAIAKRKELVKLIAIILGVPEIFQQGDGLAIPESPRHPDGSVRRPSLGALSGKFSSSQSSLVPSMEPVSERDDAADKNKSKVAAAEDNIIVNAQNAVAHALREAQPPPRPDSSTSDAMYGSLVPTPEPSGRRTSTPVMPRGATGAANLAASRTARFKSNAATNNAASNGKSGNNTENKNSENGTKADAAKKGSPPHGRVAAAPSSSKNSFPLSIAPIPPTAFAYSALLSVSSRIISLVSSLPRPLPLPAHLFEALSTAAAAFALKSGASYSALSLVAAEFRVSVVSSEVSLLPLHAVLPWLRNCLHEHSRSHTAVDMVLHRPGSLFLEISRPPKTSTQVIEYDAGTVEWLEQFKLHLKEMPPFADFVYAQCRAKFGLPSVVDRRCFELIVALADHRRTVEECEHFAQCLEHRRSSLTLCADAVLRAAIAKSSVGVKLPRKDGTAASVEYVCVHRARDVMNMLFGVDVISAAALPGANTSGNSMVVAAARVMNSLEQAALPWEQAHLAPPQRAFIESHLIAEQALLSRIQHQHGLTGLPELGQQKSNVANINALTARLSRNQAAPTADNSAVAASLAALERMASDRCVALTDMVRLFLAAVEAIELQFVMKQWIRNLYEWASPSAQLSRDEFVRLFDTARPMRHSRDVITLFDNVTQHLSSAVVRTADDGTQSAMMPFDAFERVIEHAVRDGCAFAAVPMPRVVRSALAALGVYTPSDDDVHPLAVR